MIYFSYQVESELNPIGFKVKKFHKNICLKDFKCKDFGSWMIGLWYVGFDGWIWNIFD